VERLDERPRARDDLTVVELDGEAVIYDEINGDLHRLNPTATVVFSLLDGSATLDELARELADAYGMPVEELERPVRELAAQLGDLHLLVGTEPDPPDRDGADGG
jgi:PqqD family protein of HPr-rel-A system